MRVHSIRADKLADFMAAFTRITAEAEATKTPYSVIALGGTSGNWSAIITEDRKACDLCGDDQAELRTFAFDGWVPDETWCRECYGGPHESHEYTDFPLAQEAKNNA